MVVIVLFETFIAGDAVRDENAPETDLSRPVGRLSHVEFDRCIKLRRHDLSNRNLQGCRCGPESPQCAR